MGSELDVVKKWFLYLLSAGIIRFLIVGGCSTLLDFTIYMLLSERVPISFAKAASMMSSTVLSYVLSKTWTFKYKERSDVKHLLRYFFALIINFCTNLGINYGIYRKTNKRILAFIVATCCAMTINYLLQRFFVFKVKEKNSSCDMQGR